MKLGPRTPSISKSVKASTTARVERAAKSAVNPLYGKRGMGAINNPGRAAYNYIYNRTTFNVRDAAFGLMSDSQEERCAWAESLSESLPAEFKGSHLARQHDLMLSRSTASVYPRKGEKHKLAFKLNSLESMDDSKLEKTIRKMLRAYGYEMNRHGTAGVPGNSFKANNGKTAIALNIAPTDFAKGIGVAHIRALEKWRSRIGVDKTWLVTNRPEKKALTRDACKMAEELQIEVIGSNALAAMAIEEALRRPASK